MDKKEAAKLLPCVKPRFGLTIGLIVLTLLFWIGALTILFLDRSLARGGLSPVIAQGLRWAFIPLVLVAVVQVVIHVRRHSQLKQSARRAQFKLCPKCGYELSAAAPAPEGLARCPECGDIVKVPVAVERWRAWAG